MIMTIKEKIKKWYNGDPGESHWEPVEEIRTVIRPPSHHWTARIAQILIRFFAKKWEVLIPIFLTTLGFVYTYSVDQSNQKQEGEYKRCEIQSENKTGVTIHCLK